MFFLYRDKKEEDPTVFTKNSTKLEAGACRLQLPEVRNPFSALNSSCHITVKLF